MSSSRRARRTPVAVVRTQPETYAQDLLRAAHLARPARTPRPERDLGRVITLGEVELRDPGASIAPWALEGALALVQHLEGRAPDLVMGAVGAEHRALASSGLDRVLARHGLGVETPREDLEIAVAEVDLPWLRGRRGGSVRVDARLAGRNAMVVAPLRRSRRLGIRGAVDAALATVATPRERGAEPVDPEAWAELLRLRRHLHPSSLYLLDATVCGSVGGREQPLLTDLLIVSADPVACDVVAAHLLGHDPARWTWLRRVAEEAATPLTLDLLDLRGEALDARALQAQSTYPTPWPEPRSAWAPHGVRLLADLLDPTRWTARWRRRRWNELYRRSPWGRLHQDYLEHGEARGGAAQPMGRQEMA